MTSDARQRFIDDFVRLRGMLPGAQLPWLARARAEALERFAQSGIPTLRDEDWRYTSLAALEKHSFACTLDRGKDGAELARRFALEHEGSHLLVFVNGRFEPALSAPGRLPSGATLCSLADALVRQADALQTSFEPHERQTVFGALNTALAADGAFLHLRRGTALEAPVHLLFVAAGNTDAPFATHPRNLIIAEAGTRATVIEHYAGGDEALYFVNAVTQIRADTGADIEHYKLQQEAPRAIHIGAVHGRQERDSRLHQHSIALGAVLARNDITTGFDAAGCETLLNGLYLAGARQHVDHHTRIDHAAPHGTSRETYRGVLDGAARAVFNGKVVVHPGAQKTSAHQANHNLLLSRFAEVDAKPELEIYADDVQCTHGATVGQIDDAQLFYLRSRGIEETMARGLLVHAFAHDVIERIRVGALRTRLEQILFARLPQGERIKELT